MTTLEVLKNFHDLKSDNLLRTKDTTFKADNERAMELSRLGLVRVLEIDKPKAKLKSK